MNFFVQVFTNKQTTSAVDIYSGLRSISLDIEIYRDRKLFVLPCRYTEYADMNVYATFIVTIYSGNILFTSGI